MHVANIWQDMFLPGLPIVEKILRPVVVYFFLVIGLRLAGKRELAQLNPFDLVVLLTLANTVQDAIIGNDNSLTGGIIGAATLLVLNYFVVRFLYRHHRLERLAEGKETVLVKDGKVQERWLRRELITRYELVAAATRNGFRSLAEVDLAVLEPGGQITFVRKGEAPEEVRHQELLARLDLLSRDLAAWRASQS
jgi:uncharacterized membrane protein YcaP (DUF421 family)